MKRSQVRVQESEMKLRGEITAFLSLVFILLISFVLGITESAYIQTAKNLSRLDVDRSIFSVFGEYEKELLEDYEIFAFDASYGSGTFTKDLILNRLAYYGSMGVQQEVTDIQFLTDRNGQAFREGVITFTESQSGIESLRELTGWTQEWKEQSAVGEEITDSLDQMLEENSSLLPEESSDLTGYISSGNFMSLVLPKDFQVSEKSITKEEQVSIRTKNMGWGTLPIMQGLGNFEEKLLFQKYVMDRFGTAVSSKGEERNLDYEIEYLIEGKRSDEENLKAVITKLFLFRMAMNYMYLQTDSGKQQEAAVMATAISVVLLNPEVEMVIKQLLLALWAFGESVLDLRSLLDGRKVAFNKSESSWQLSLSSLFSLGTSDDAIEGKDDENGIGYEQYLQILLCLKSIDEVTMRTLDRIEQNLIVEKKLTNFHMDTCVTKIKLLNKAEIGAGYQYEFPIYYGYL